MAACSDFVSIHDPIANLFYLPRTYSRRHGIASHATHRTAGFLLVPTSSSSPTGLRFAAPAPLDLALEQRSRQVLEHQVGGQRPSRTEGSALNRLRSALPPKVGDRIKVRA